MCLTTFFQPPFILFHFLYFVLSVTSTQVPEIFNKNTTIIIIDIDYNENVAECYWKDFLKYNEILGNPNWSPVLPLLCVAIYWYRRVENILGQIYTLLHVLDH